MNVTKIEKILNANRFIYSNILGIYGMSKSTKGSSVNSTQPFSLFFI